MKKLIAISVVFALVAGVAFALDFGGTIVGTVKVIEAASDGSPVTGSGDIDKFRISGGGEVADGKFGGYIRLGDDIQAKANQYWAWWKPIDQLKLTIGMNADGWFEVNGNACWMFYQGATDTGVTLGGTNAWGWTNETIHLADDWSSGGDFKMRRAFNTPFDGGLAIEITPVDMVAINIGFPFFDGGGKIEEIFKKTFAQVALNLSFGSFAFTYAGSSDITSSEIFGYFGLKAIENLQIDFGLGTNFTSDTNSDRLHLGIAVKYGAESWGIKFRSLFAIPVKGTQDFGMLFDILPYFVINDSLRVFVSGGFSLYNVSKIEDGALWHVNPYIEVGEEWGPRFLAGIKVFQGIRGNSGTGSFDTAPVKFEVPIALIVSF